MAGVKGTKHAEVVGRAVGGRLAPTADMYWARVTARFESSQ
jgi:hypothetical protein